MLREYRNKLKKKKTKPLIIEKVKGWWRGVVLKDTYTSQHFKTYQRFLENLFYSKDIVIRIMSIISVWV